jgi:hypothetical protein
MAPMPPRYGAAPRFQIELPSQVGFGPNGTVTLLFLQELVGPASLQPIGNSMLLFFQEVLVKPNQFSSSLPNLNEIHLNFEV